jgi:UDP-4-amino-4,6-dideoxy-N-acetyl-beta-L-altrosamine transaminase
MAMKDYLPFSLPDIGNEEIEEVTQVLKSGWITTGPKVKEFEENFASFIGSKHAVAVNSGTAALHLALEAIGLKEGDQVITSPLTFAATAEVVCYFGAHPVFVDIDERTMNLDAEKLEEHFVNHDKDKVKAIIPVHYGGLPCNMDRIMKIAQRYGLRVIEDAAHAFPVKYQGQMIGTIGDATCFSFYATKTITTAEGGMLTTNDDAVAERARIMRLHGISKDAWMRYTAQGNWYYEIVAPGFKYNLTDIAAALGLVQLKRAYAMWEKRREVADTYNEAFKGLPEIKTPYFAGDHAWHLYVIRLDTEKLKIDREEFIEELRRKGIGTSVHFIPLHIHPFYRDTYHYQLNDYPVSSKVYKQIISLPVYSKMSVDDAHRVADVVKEVIEKNRAS